MEQTLLGLSLLINVILGLIIFYRGILKDKSGLLMSGSILFVILWTIGDYLMLFGRSAAVIEVGRWMWVTTPMIGILVLYAFARNFLYQFKSKLETRIYKVLLGVAAIWIGFFALNPTRIIKSVTLTTSGQNGLLHVPAAFRLYGLFFSIYFPAAVFLLFIKYRQLKGLQKSQAQYVLIGSSLLLFTATITNLALPILFNNLGFLWLGPIFSIFYVASFTYAILKHQLFDINRLLARSLAYVLVVGSLALLLIALLLPISALLTNGAQTNNRVNAVYVVLALFVALSFQPLKKRFDRLTNRIFYRDAYEPQYLLDELNTSLVTTFDLEALLKASASTTAKYLKSEFVTFIIHFKEEGDNQLFGRKLALTKEDLNELTVQYQPTKTKVLLDSETDRASSKVLAFMQHHSIEAIISLVTHREHVGYLLLGAKKSGNPYSKFDKKMMEIIGEELAIAIQNSLRFEEIKRFNLTLQDKVNQATLELRHANEKLKQLDQTKDEFISMASHQLRTPLTTIKGYLSMVLEGDKGPVKADQKDMIERAFNSADNMVFLIADLLNISRLQSGKFVIENRPTDLPDIVEKQIQQIQEEAAHRKIELVYQKPKDFPTLNIDDNKIRQVVMNFLDNAVFYTPNGGTVTVQLKATDTAVEYTVTDTGMGVPKSAQHHLFSKFFRADNAKKMRPDGTGLGLFMAKKVIAAQGGAVLFSSAEGKGSTFGFSLPLSKVTVSK